MKKKYLLLTVIAAAAGFIFASGAGAADYIFKYSEDFAADSVHTFSAESIDADYVAFDFYTCDDEELLDEMLDRGVIEYYEPNYTVELFDTTSDTRFNSWQIDYEYKLINAISAVNNGVYNGSGVTIGIIDSGLTDNHRDIDYDKIASKRNVITGDVSSVTDTTGHGTMVTGIIAAATDNGIGMASLANQAELVIIKAFAEGRDTRVTHIVEAINYAIEHDCDVINMSFGIKNNSKTLETAINNALAEGIIPVAAAGNHTSKDPDKPLVDSAYQYPASYDGVVSVASIGKTGERSSFSYHNDKVNIAACGESVLSLVYDTTDSYTYGNGTSFSAPFVTAAAALAKQIDPDMTSTEFLALLGKTASEAPRPEAGEASYETSYGSGILNVGAMLDALLGVNITVSDGVIDENDWYARSVMTNNGFDSYDLLDVWYIFSDGKQSNRRLSHITLEARSSVTTEYLGWFTVCHLTWFDDGSMIPLRPKDEIETGIL